MEEQKHSGLGIASFITSIVVGMFMFGLIVAAGVMEASTPGGLDEESVEAVVIGLLMFLFLGLTMVALGLGIAGIVQKGRKKLFAILGTIFSSLTILLTAFILIIGMTVE